MSDQFKVEVVDDPQALVVVVETQVQPDVEVSISNDPQNLIVEIDNGIAGPAGAPGVGVPTGGTTGQVLQKASSTNYDTQWATLTKNDVGLGNVDNTSDLNKPISTATQTALNGKFDNPTGNSTQYLDGAGVPTTFPTIITDHGQLTGLLDDDHPQYLLESEFNNQNILQKEPTGFPNRTDSTMSFNDGTREFTISPAVSSFDIYIKGTKFTFTTAQTITIPNLAGNHYIYFDNAGALQTTQVFDSAIIQDYAFTAIIYWNTDTSTHTYRAEERHGLVMDGMTHSYLHTVFGARFISGLALQGFSVDGSGTANASAQFSVDSGSIRDEDILIQSPAQAQIPILYRQGQLWRKKPADSFPVIYSGTAGYTGANGRLPFNELVSGSWQLTQAANSYFILVHFFATNDLDNPVVGIQGINQYNSITSARQSANEEISTLAGLPFAEFVPIGSVIFETATGYSNTPQARVRSTDTGANYVDFRGTQLYAPAAGTATSHSLLSNLSNDDHLQYHNDARGDARYYTKTEVDALTIVNALIFG